MILKKVLIFTLFACSLSLLAQVKNNELQIGVGVGIVKFSEEDASFIGDQYLFQVPTLNLTVPINDHVSIDGAMSFNTFDPGFITNSVKYFSMDGSIRYSFIHLSDDFMPYVFAGASLVDSELKMTPTINVGAGATYWLTDIIGLNAQVYYKYSLESFESMRSHIQVTGGLVFALDMQDLFGGGGSSGGTCYHNQH